MIICFDELLSNYCSYKIGGRAKKFYLPVTTSDLIEIINKESGNTILFGGGTNILFPDYDIERPVVCFRRMNRWIIDKGDKFSVGAGVLLDELVRFAVDKSIEGFENLSGIPGTVGGAVIMNAGAFGVEIKDIILGCEVFDLKENKIEYLKSGECGFGYRRADGLKDKVVLSADFKKSGYTDKSVLLRKREEILRKRASKQPLDYPSCGSVFKRPEGGYAGELIEKSGLKGYRIGGAKVSEKHANFIINVDNATSNDVRELIFYVQKRVEENFGIRLEPEVKIIS